MSRGKTIARGRRPGKIPMKRYLQERRVLARQLSRIGFIWSGSVSRRRLTCGNNACACHQDPLARHGPYVFWTTKKRGKTVGRLLRNAEADILIEWVDNRKRLEEIEKKLLKLSEKAFKTELRVRTQEIKMKENRPQLIEKK
jgi:hypothetical protein